MAIREGLLHSWSIVLIGSYGWYLCRHDRPAILFGTALRGSCGACEVQIMTRVPTLIDDARLSSLATKAASLGPATIVYHAADFLGGIFDINLSTSVKSGFRAILAVI